MMNTRPVDGTQKTANGLVTWTYSSDDGLQIVISVS
jgi:hypothetical protein